METSEEDNKDSDKDDNDIEIRNDSLNNDGSSLSNKDISATVIKSEYKAEEITVAAVKIGTTVSTTLSSVNNSIIIN